MISVVHPSNSQLERERLATLESSYHEIKDELDLLRNLNNKPKDPSPVQFSSPSQQQLYLSPQHPEVSYSNNEHQSPLYSNPPPHQQQPLTPGGDLYLPPPPNIQTNTTSFPSSSTIQVIYCWVVLLYLYLLLFVC
jgi:hypothetical protein